VIRAIALTLLLEIFWFLQFDLTVLVIMQYISSISIL